MSEAQNISAFSVLFENTSDPKRKQLIGKEIDQILAPYYDRPTPNQIAQSLIARFGSEALLPRNPVLKAVVFGLDKNEIQKLSNHLNLSYNHIDIYDEVLASLKVDITPLLEFYNLPNYFSLRSLPDNRSTSEVLSLKYEQPLVSKGYPHSYQNRIKIEALQKVRSIRSEYKALIVMPTGSGKTRTALEFMIDFIRGESSTNILWAVESPGLSEQSLSAFKGLWNQRGDRELTIHRCFNKFKPNFDPNNGVNITFGAFAKINSLKDENDAFYSSLKRNLNLLIIDEAHSSLAETYESLISDIQTSSRNLITIGLTATPMRNDDNDLFNLKTYFSRNSFEISDKNLQRISDPISYLQSKGFLAHVDCEYLNIPHEQIAEKSKEFNSKIIERIKVSLEEKKQIIVFAMSKHHAIALKILLQEENVKVACITGDTPPHDRLVYFDEFQSKSKDSSFKLNVLVNYGILSTGIDLPRVDELFILRKFGNLTTAMQVVGRALRGKKNGGNERNKIISVKSNRDTIHSESDLFNAINNMY